MKNKGVFRLHVFSFRRIKQLYAFELLYAFQKTVPQSRGTANTERDLAVVVEGKAIKGYLME